ncbi:hypothetical protein A2U01_0087508, partial [Trifolium medium]|nr:hypothetical protein [Trifolium medium]
MNELLESDVTLWRPPPMIGCTIG